MFVYVPPPAKRNSANLRKDYPPGDPPELHYLGRVANYWEVLEDSSHSMGVGGFEIAKLSSDQVAWLKAIEAKVREIMTHD